MGHHRQRYGFEHRGGHAGNVYREALARTPRGLKITLVLTVLLVVLAGLALAGFAVLMLVKLVVGGTLPGYLQSALDFGERNLQPLLDVWKTLRGLAGN